MGNLVNERAEEIYSNWKDDLPDGWVLEFQKFCYLLSYTAFKEGIGDFEVLQVKEKFGSARVYVAPYNEKVEAVINSFEGATMRICNVCGKEATKLSTDWILPYCDECFEKNHTRQDYYLIKDLIEEGED